LGSPESVAGIVLLVGLLLYPLPAIIGWRKRDRWAIAALNLFLGWTFIGWVIALVWALRAETGRTVQV
jgi:hypothetical protein